MMTVGSEGELTGRLGDYQLESLLGRGGMAEVYRARELSLGREVAVKVLPTKLAHDHTYVARFRTEARRVAALQHPHIVPVYYYSENGPLLYLVMPVLKESLRDRLHREGRLDPLEAIRICQEIASGLEAAHKQGLIHRDVKPENILLDGAGSAMLTDFGIARAVSPAGQAPQARAQTLTGSGLPVGTPEYMAPELLRNENVDIRSDIYALGAVLYEVLTGRAPHEAGTPFEIAALALMTPISPPSRYNPAIWPALEQAIMTALAAKPNARFQSVAAFAGALTRAGEFAGTDVPVSSTASVRVRGTQRFTRSQELPETSEAIAEASTLPVIAVARPAGSARSPVAWWRAQSKRRRWVATVGAVALLAITLLSGGSLYALGSGPPGPSAGTPSGGIPAATVTAISAALATAIAQQTPGAAATATALATQATGPTVAPGQTTPSQPTSTPQLTATTVPGTLLQISPVPLVLAPTQTDPEICLATQRITNTANKAVGWAWQNAISQGNPRFRLNGQQVNSPPMDPGLAAGGQDMLTITADCTTPSQSAVIVVKDTLGNTYTFEVTVQ